MKGQEGAANKEQLRKDKKKKEQLTFTFNNGEVNYAWKEYKQTEGRRGRPSTK